MKKFVRVFRVYALILLLVTGVRSGLAWRNARQQRKDNALFVAIQDNNLNAVRTLLKQGADPNGLYELEDTRPPSERLFDFIIPLHHYSQRERFPLAITTGKLDIKIEIVKALLDAGANPNPDRSNLRSTDDRIVNPLVVAEDIGNCKVAHLLLKHHADVHARDEDNMTALMIAARMNNCDEVRFLLQHGANIEEKDHGGERALDWAAEFNADAVVEYFIKRGVDVNYKDLNGRTALRHAREANAHDAEKLLLKAGAVE